MIFFFYLIISIILFEKTKHAFLNETACQFNEKEMICSNFSNFTELNFSNFSNSNVSKLELIPIENIPFDMDSFSLSELKIMPNSTLVLRNFNSFPFYFSDLLRNFSILVIDNSSLIFSAKPEITTISSTTTTFESTTEVNSTTAKISNIGIKESINTE